MIALYLLTAIADWTICGHIPPEKVVVQSHRGFGALAPENTVESFERAWKMGTIPEADVRMSKDGVMIAFHDGNFARVVKNAPPELKTKRAEDLTWDELKALDVGDGERIARIDQVLARMQGKHRHRRLYLDIKSVDLPALARMVKDHGVEPRVILASTNYDLITRWRALAPRAGTLHWMGGTEAQLRARLETLRAVDFAGITQLQIHVKKAKEGQQPFTPSPRFLSEVGAELRKRKILFQVLPWDARDPASYRTLLDLGVMSFATDFPDVTKQAIRDFCPRK